MQTNEVEEQAQLRLTSTSQGIQVEWFEQNTGRRKAKPLKFHIDINKVFSSHKTFPAPKQGALNQALGKKTKRVIDATAGWGGDALLMCSQGYQVTLIERNPIMALLLKDAMQRLQNTQWAEQNSIFVPQIVEGDAITVLAKGEIEADCVYLDPMFPAKKKQSAAVKKNMQLLQWLVGNDEDANDLVQAAKNGGYARFTVKRPHHAEPLSGVNDNKKMVPNERFSSKLVHYDVYLNTNRV